MWKIFKLRIYINIIRFHNFMLQWKLLKNLLRGSKSMKFDQLMMPEVMSSYSKPIETNTEITLYPFHYLPFKCQFYMNTGIGQDHQCACRCPSTQQCQGISSHSADQICFFVFLCLQWFCMTFVDQMTSFKMADEITWNLKALRLLSFGINLPESSIHWPN